MWTYSTLWHLLYEIFRNSIIDENETISFNSLCIMINLVLYLKSFLYVQLGQWGQYKTVMKTETMKHFTTIVFVGI